MQSSSVSSQRDDEPCTRGAVRRRPEPLVAVLMLLALTGSCAFVAAGPPAQGTGSASRAETRATGQSGRAPAGTRAKPGGLSPAALDQLLAGELKRFGVEPGQPLSDEEFLRRVYLDVVGHIPPADRVRSFAKDNHPRKRARLVRELTESPEYARHWGRFWCDVITFRTRGEDDHLKPETLEDWFAGQLARNTPWNEVVRQLITATGRNDESGPANFILAQMARPEDLAAETARVFLGVQLQCAQCHDDPNGVWKRQQFHELAAFFGRVDEERVNTGREPELPPGVKMPTPPFQVITLDQARREYMMPDKDDASRVTPIAQPRAPQAPPLPSGLSDAERRGFLAAWVTGPNNMWFPRAFVNRVWTQLIGSGFTTIVDDMGPDRPVLCPTVLYRIAAAWRTSGYDVRWLIELLLNSQVYQSKSPAASGSEMARFAGVAPTRLQPRQILDSLAVALDLRANALSGPLGTRLARTFEFDPSTPSDQVASTVSQSLLMMNDPDLCDMLDRHGQKLIGRILQRSDDREVIEWLYLRTLARHPSGDEADLCLAHLAEVGDRQPALEDVLWCLINTTEFAMKR